MGTAYHVNGVAQIKVGTGTAGALELLGHSINGVDIDPTIIHRPIYTDAGGGEGGIPAAHNKVGQIDVVSCDLIVYDSAVLHKVLKGIENILATAAEGVMLDAGTILDNTAVGGSGVGGYYRLLVLSPSEADPHNYLYARLIRAPQRRSTQPLVYRLAWEAIPYIGTGTTASGVVLYNAITT